MTASQAAPTRHGGGASRRARPALAILLGVTDTAVPLPGVRWAPWAAAGAVLWTVVLTAVQVDVGGPLVVVPGLALGPLVASLFLPWRSTGLLAVLAIAMVTLLSVRQAALTDSSTVLRVAGTSATAGFAVLNAAVRRHRETRLARVAEVAAVAQGAILHAVPPALGGYRLAARYLSATEDALVGGDLYDAVLTSRGLRVLLGDVRGKGLPAVRTAAHALAAFRQLAPRAELRLVDVATELERALRDELGEEDFVTAVLCELGPLGSLEIVNCGHPAPLHVPLDGTVSELHAGQASPPLGLGVRPVADRHVLAPGDRLLLFSDGLSETRDAVGRFFPLHGQADALRHPDAQYAVDSLVRAAAAHAGRRLSDDVAVLLVVQDEHAAPLPEPVPAQR